MTFDSATNDQIEPYDAYVKMCKNFGVRPQLNYFDFRDLYSIFCFDITAQDDNLVSNGCDIIIHITKDPLLLVQCYCLILEEKVLKINLKNGMMHMIS